MAWVDLGLKRSDEYREGQAAVAADRFPRSSDPKHEFPRLARPLRLAATIVEKFLPCLLQVSIFNESFVRRFVLV